MNNEWLNTLRSRMENHEEEVPEGLWDDIKDELFSQEEDNKQVIGFIPAIDAENEGKKIAEDTKSKSWLYRIGGIAAAAVLIFVMIKVLPEDDQKKFSQNSIDSNKEIEKNLPLKHGEPEKKIGTKEEAKADVSLAQNNADRGNLSAKNVKYTTSEQVRNTIIANRENDQATIKVPEVIGSVSAYEENKPKEMSLADDKIKNEVVDKEVNKAGNEWPEKYADNTKAKIKSKSEKKWMLSMLTGNASSNSAEQQFHGYASVNGKPMNFEQVWSASEYVDDPLTQVLLANQSKPVEARIRHKIPVTFGLSLYYNLGKKWGIGTGVNYTKLASELHSGSNDNYIKGEQVVHYIGIPVQINYNVIQKGRFTGYVTGGAMLEKPISGSVTTSYVVHDEVRETSKENMEHKPLSFSVNTAVGLQVKVVNRVGIYAEPGIGYHFKDEDSPNTIYKEKPLHFNVKFGIRLLID
ncbi:outer membrane beta-barrel protein [Chryseobacterium sp. c4a]|uniref:outer membrane beta-barrel protein n=1 Tax=Chryseobacterium sp. c4a TaxID=1573582 RepID=UPI001358D795|nr:outer membrane beta-barrel protein [Chryseobacterium sp. c4a]